MYKRISNSDFIKLIKLNESTTLELDVISNNISFSDFFNFYSSTYRNDTIIISGFKDKNKELMTNSIKFKIDSICEIKTLIDEGSIDHIAHSKLKLILDDTSLVNIYFENYFYLD